MIFGLLAPMVAADEKTPSIDGKLRVTLRRQAETSKGSGRFYSVTEPVLLEPQKTAIVICDMWDQHWCKGATDRVQQLATRMNEVVNEARRRGVFIIHCPSDTMDFYKDTPQRKLAQAAPHVEPKVPLQNWCSLEEQREGKLPIDDSDGGCDCSPTCKQGGPWKRQIAAIEIKEGDAITDNAEAYYLLQQRGIDTVIVMGVHTNMCVLGRPFSIRQMTHQGKNVILMRDMTDTMYNSRSAPFVSHFTGTDLVVDHIERHWCATITSDDIVGGKPFRFAEDKRPHVVIVTAENEYKTEETLPPFAAKNLSRDFRVSIVYGDEQHPHNLVGSEAINDADVLLISVRRRPLLPAQLALIRKHVEAGKPVVGIRTASHSFSLRGATPPAGTETWESFDADVLGGHYTTHYANELHPALTLAPGAAAHPILRGIKPEELKSHYSLYVVNPLEASTSPLVIGEIPDKPAEPVAWTNENKYGGRVFYTSLGHPDDFASAGFVMLLRNGICWAAGLEVPAE